LAGLSELSFLSKRACVRALRLFSAEQQRVVADVTVAAAAAAGGAASAESAT